jgi:hypothetical protein
LGLEQGRRDDLEGLTYVLLYFLRGQLPWQGLQAANQKDKYHKICLKKQNIPVRELCKGLPAEFGTLLCYCRNLKFDETPNYNYCRKLLREVFEANGYALDYVYDWTVKQQVGGICLPLSRLACTCFTVPANRQACAQLLQCAVDVCGERGLAR